MTAISPDDPDYQYLAPNKKKLQEEQTQPFDGKKNCWIPDQKEGYVKAEIISTKGDDVTVLLTDKMEVSSASLCELLYDSKTAFTAWNSVGICCANRFEVLPRPQEGCEVLQSACLYVCLRVCLSVCSHIFKIACPYFTTFSVHVTCGRGSVLL